MSRSLDRNILSQLRLEDPRPVYDDLARLFTDLPESDLLEIEFLGQSHQLEPGINFLRDGTAVAIPKLRLVQAFFVAHQILRGHLGNNNNNKIITDDVHAATFILLLMDPEHLTAANIRKRALSAARNATQIALKREQRFVDALLTARLHRHTKSPTLWSHRRWLVATCWALGMPWDIRHDIQNVVMVAGQRHPRNYVAWQHARFLLDRDPSLAATIAADAKDFCLRNQSDISGWAFLSDCITRIQDEEIRLSVCSSVLEQTLSMTESFRWTNESVWVFLRTLVAREHVDDQDLKRFMVTNTRLSATTPRHTPQWEIIEKAREWSDKYCVPK